MLHTQIPADDDQSHEAKSWRMLALDCAPWGDRIEPALQTLWSSYTHALVDVQRGNDLLASSQQEAERLRIECASRAEETRLLCIDLSQARTSLAGKDGDIAVWSTENGQLKRDLEGVKASHEKTQRIAESMEESATYWKGEAEKARRESPTLDPESEPSALALAVAGLGDSIAHAIRDHATILTEKSQAESLQLSGQAIAERIDKRARDYADHQGFNDGSILRAPVTKAFMAGARWGVKPLVNGEVSW